MEQASEVKPAPIVKYCEGPPCNNKFSPCTRICPLCHGRPMWPDLATKLRAFNTKCSVINDSVMDTLFKNATGKIY